MGRTVTAQYYATSGPALALRADPVASISSGVTVDSVRAVIAASRLHIEAGQVAERIRIVRVDFTDRLKQFQCQVVVLACLHLQSECIFYFSAGRIVQIVAADNLFDLIDHAGRRMNLKETLRQPWNDIADGIVHLKQLHAFLDCFVEQP